jgi:thymidylate synthase ThyX
MIQDYPHVKAEVIADSVRENLQDRVTTFLLSYPRFIHPQMMTHRMCARNAQSSRAVPVERMIKQVRMNPVIPIAFLANQRGMVGGEPIADPEIALAHWRAAAYDAADAAENLSHLGVHKQHSNRLLEPYLTITAVFTFQGPWLDHFFGLRMGHDAQPEIQCVADHMHQALAKSNPAVKKLGEWHLPFVTEAEIETASMDCLPSVSAARCARASYLNFDGKRDMQKDIQLFGSLVKDRHGSPLEHVLTPYAGPHGVFTNWQSLRSVHGQ